MCKNTGCTNCNDNCGCTCNACCNNDCNNCCDPCNEQPCGCPFEVDFACVRYQGPELDCLNLSTGETLEQFITAFNEVFCNLSDGVDGIDGDSAYQIWLNLGNVGTEQDFIDSLQGADGADGATGADGTDGNFVQLIPEPAGVNCENGGVIVQLIDGTDGVTVLDSEYICNGVDGTTTSTTVEIFEAGEAGNFVVPAGVTQLTVEMHGGGAGGSIYQTNEEILLSSGGGALFIKALLTVTPGQVLPYSVGNGGGSSAGVLPIKFQGDDGEDSTFGTLTANGGSAASFVAGSPTNTLNKGLGGAQAPSGTNQTINGGDGEVVILSKFGEGSNEYNDGHSFGGFSSKSGFMFVPNSSIYTEVTQPVTTIYAGTGGGTSFALTYSAGPTNPNPRFTSSLGIGGKIVITYNI
jgi:hypothetical protein